MSSSFLGNQTLSQASLADAVESAAGIVDRQLLADKRHGDLTDLLKVQSHKLPTASGLNDYDYPSITDTRAGLVSLPELSTVKRVPLPPELVEQFGHMQCNCMMGLFPEISRAWLSIDSDIFVWNYEHGGDLAYFDGLNETILSAGLVKPKPGIFQPHIHYLLCLTTPVDIVLLGVSFSSPHLDPITDPGFGEMHLLPDPLFTVPTDNTYILSISGTESGRIFMTGKDGCLYELAYQAEDGWFSRRCRKINHSTSSLSFLVPSFLNFSFAEDDPLIQISIDESRHILYTRSEKGTIQVFDLGEDGQGMSRVAAITQTTILQNAALVARTIDRSNFKPIIHIAAVTRNESTNVHLIAVTHTGVRLYFTTCYFGETRSRPSMLSLLHVRLPPGFSAISTQQRPTNSHMAHYKRGTLLLAASQSEDNDLLWALSPDTFPFQSQLMETTASAPIDGRTWAICEVPLPLYGLGVPSDPLGMPTIDPPLVVTQHMEPVRRFVLLTAQGSHLMNKLRPVDQLRQLLLNNNGPDSEEVKAFFKLHRADQACATCLILACSKLAVDKQVADWAARAFFLYGGEAQYSIGGNPPPSNIGPTFHGNTSTIGTSGFASPGPGQTSFSGFTTPAPGMHPNQMSTPITSGFGQQPQQQQQQQQQQSTFTSGLAHEMMFSGKHDGLCLYVGRIVRPLWDYRVVNTFTVQGKQGQKEIIGSRLSSEDLGWFTEQLSDLNDFIQAHSQFTIPVMTDSMTPGFTPRGTLPRPDGAMDEQARRRYQAELQTQEKISTQQMEQLIERMCEVLGLWKIVCDHQFHVVAGELTQDQQNQLRSMTFKNFVVHGKEICCALISCLIKRYLGDNATTDAISSKLREVCPSLYSTEDAVASKANELLQSAKITQNKYERDRLLREALLMYKQIPQQLDLPVVCGQLSSVRYYDGIVDLCLTAASKRDPQGLALHHYKNGAQPEDTQGWQAFSLRMDCYRCITEMLSYLLSTSMSHPQAPSVPRSPGPPPAPDPHRLTNTEAEQYTEQVFKLCLKSEDEVFHVALYEWLIAENLTEKLLEVQSPFLETYLKQTANYQPDNLDTLDLLWKYYEKTRNFTAAARIQAKLAERRGTDIPLPQRLEYLSRAIMCAKSSSMRTSSANEGEFLHELEEKMEVARIQLQVLEMVSKLPSHHTEDSISRLNSELMDITTLYGEFAEPYGLAECKLAIVHCAGHYDPTLVESLWQDIVDKEFEHSLASAPQTRMATISKKLVILGKLYGATERYFPLAFLVKYLEKKSCEYSFDSKWVFTTLQQIGVSMPKLQEVYDRLFKSKDPYWQAMRKPLHLLTVLRCLVESYTDAPNTVPAYERRAFTTTCLDNVAAYLVELQSIVGGDTTVRTLIAEFKGVQAKLERLQC
ncbi:nuclear pore complex protein Nup155 [Lingula anatina]|uniref:Nuclear pore complex protein Nup155 n=1 Tax=Lingula anatina TaxID=7574 RepID=A0A1S3J6G6_LINAN|nr:nuclear pore complex protein Nup155 [Lingula anatina]|eukprot:XP_013406007.1 nuclear pore complex protein Nup155 [Lingula anatina]